MKKILIGSLLTVGLIASDLNSNPNSSFDEKVLNEIKATLNSAQTDKEKLENMKKYILGLKLNNDVKNIEKQDDTKESVAVQKDDTKKEPTKESLLSVNGVKKYVSNIEFNDNVDKKKYAFNLMGHYENYMLLGGHTNNRLIEKSYNTNGSHDPSRDYERDTNEAQFQLSIKVPLYANFLGTGGDLFTAYTQNSYWQVFDTAHSSPFRETNYMPELFMEWNPDKKVGNSQLKKVRFALIHQSNGQDLGKSRSWNRTELHFLFQKENIFYGFNMWDRWNESPKSDPTQIEGDDNVGLEDYIGKQKYFVKYKTDYADLMLSHQNRILHYDINKGNTKLDLTIPSGNKNFDFFVRYFNGYGESLIDYDTKIQRVSFGIMIADWL